MIDYWVLLRLVAQKSAAPKLMLFEFSNKQGSTASQEYPSCAKPHNCFGSTRGGNKTLK